MRGIAEIPQTFSVTVAECPDGIENSFLVKVAGEAQPAVFMQVLDGVRHQVGNGELNVIQDLRSASLYFPPGLLAEFYRHMFRSGIHTFRLVTVDPDPARSQMTKFAAIIARLVGLAAGMAHVTHFEQGYDALRRLLAKSREDLLETSPAVQGHLSVRLVDDHFVYPTFSVRVEEAPWGIAGTILVETSGRYVLDELAETYREWLKGHVGETLNVFADERKGRSWPTVESVNRFYGMFLAAGIRRMSLVMIDEDPLRPARMAHVRDLARKAGLDIHVEVVATPAEAVGRMRALLAKRLAGGDG